MLFLPFLLRKNFPFLRNKSFLNGHLRHGKRVSSQAENRLDVFQLVLFLFAVPSDVNEDVPEPWPLVIGTHPLRRYQVRQMTHTHS